jgi:CheY-like chemotaxis protein
VTDAVVLIVEDDPDLRSMMDYLLHQEGFTPVTAANGRDALRLLKAGLAVRLILLDLMMPVMDGWAFRREQLRDPEIAWIPVIVLSAADDIRYDELVPAAVFRKPLVFDRMLGAIRTWVQAEPDLRAR